MREEFCREDRAVAQQRSESSSQRSSLHALDVKMDQAEPRTRPHAAKELVNLKDFEATRRGAGAPMGRASCCRSYQILIGCAFLPTFASHLLHLRA